MASLVNRIVVRARGYSQPAATENGPSIVDPSEQLLENDQCLQDTKSKRANRLSFSLLHRLVHGSRSREQKEETGDAEESNGAESNGSLCTSTSTVSTTSSQKSGHKRSCNLLGSVDLSCSKHAEVLTRHSFCCDNEVSSKDLHRLTPSEHSAFATVAAPRNQHPETIDRGPLHSQPKRNTWVRNITKPFRRFHRQLSLPSFTRLDNTDGLRRRASF